MTFANPLILHLEIGINILMLNFGEELLLKKMLRNFAATMRCLERLKREWGENPRQSRCCKFHEAVQPATGDNPGRRTMPKRVRRPAASRILTLYATPRGRAWLL